MQVAIKTRTKCFDIYRLTLSAGCSSEWLQNDDGRRSAVWCNTSQPAVGDIFWRRANDNDDGKRFRRSSARMEYERENRERENREIQFSYLRDRPRCLLNRRKYWSSLGEWLSENFTVRIFSIEQHLWPFFKAIGWILARYLYGGKFTRTLTDQDGLVYRHFLETYVTLTLSYREDAGTVQKRCVVLSLVRVGMFTVKGRLQCILI